MVLTDASQEADNVSRLSRQCVFGLRSPVQKSSHDVIEPGLRNY